MKEPMESVKTEAWFLLLFTFIYFTFITFINCTSLTDVNLFTFSMEVEERKRGREFGTQSFKK